MRKIAAIFLLILIPITIWAYEPLTDDEITAYWSSLTKAERIEEIRKLDNIDHAIPEIVVPPLVAVLAGRDLYISYEDPEGDHGGLLIDIAGELRYSVELEGLTAKNFVPFNIKPYIVTGSACLIAGIVAGLLISR